MRITKKFLREAKAILSKRVHQVCLMSSEQLLEEFAQMFPESAAMPEGYTREQMAKQILERSIEVAIPSHLCD